MPTIVPDKGRWMRSAMLMTLMGLFAGCASAYTDERARSPHFREGVFNNSHQVDWTWWDFLKMRINTDYADWPEWVESPYGPAPLPRVTGGELRMTLIGHATVLIQAEGYNILTDPVYSQRVGPFSLLGPSRVRNPGIRFEELPRIDLVLISHDHYDHLDLPTLERVIERDNPRIFLGLGVGERLGSMQNVRELDWWERVEVSEGFSLTFVPVRHFSGRTLTDRNTTLWGGFVMEIGGRKIYFGGDSAYGEHYRETFERFGPMDLALLPIGAYSPRSFMGFAHIDPAEAVQAHLELHARKSVGMHYGTFQQTAEKIDEPVELLIRERAKAKLTAEDFVIVEFGEPLVLPE